MSAVAKVAIGSAILVFSVLNTFTNVLPHGSGFVLLAASVAFLIYMVRSNFLENERRRKAVDARISNLTTRAARDGK